MVRIVSPRATLCTAQPGGVADLQRGSRGPGAGRQTGQEDGLQGHAGGGGAAEWSEAGGGAEESGLEGRGVHG